MKRLFIILSIFLITTQLYAQTGCCENDPVNALSNYPQKTSELIFSLTKDLPDNTQLSIAIIQDGKTNYYGIVKSIIQITMEACSIF